MNKEEEFEEFGDRERWDMLDVLHDIRLELAVVAGTMLGAVAVAIVALAWFLNR